MIDLSTPSGLMLALVPDAFVAAGAMLLMVVSAFVKDRPGSQRTVGVVAIFVCLGGLGLVAVNAVLQASATPGPIAVDAFRWAVDAVVLLATAGSIALSIEDGAREGAEIPEVHVMTLFAAVGMMLLVAARDLMVLFLAIELMSLSVYVLAGINRRSARSAESALKYFLLGSFSTGFLLYGIALTYGATGSTSLSVIGLATSTGLQGREVLLYGGIAMLLIGFGFKVSAAPFHMWAPDVYEGAPTPVTAFMSAAVKAAAFAAFVRVWTEAFPSNASVWRGPVGALAVATMIVGSLIGLQQKNIKRMLAYSSIVHSGYIMVAVLAPTAVGRSALLFYLVAYTIATLGAFAVVSAVSLPGERQLKLADYAGLWRARPWMALAMGIFMLAMLGFPIFGGIGFLSKWYVLNAALAGPIKMPVIATAIVLTSCISAGFYLYVITLMFMKEPPADAQVVREGPWTRGVIAVAAVAILALGIASGPLVRWAEHGAPMANTAAQVVEATTGR